jgi:hypothetical protein
MILHQMEQIHRRHFEYIAMQALAAKPDLWSCMGRFKQPIVTNPQRPTVSFNLVTVNL